MSFYYLATPYSRYPHGIERAFKDAALQASLLVKAGIPVYSPIAHTHPLAMEGGIDPLDHSIWLEADRTFMEAAKALVVCRMEGWQESYGIEEEVKAFTRMGKRIYQMEPGFVPPELLHKRKIVGLVGYAGSGKDAAAKALIEDGWVRVAFADAVREALLALNPIIDWCANTNDSGDTVEEPIRLAEHVQDAGWEIAKRDTEVRRLLQRLGTEAGRNIHGPDCWTNIACRKIEATDANVVITDVRFPNEAAMIRAMGGKLIRIVRPGVGAVNNHVSDAGLDAIECDQQIDNGGALEFLHAAIREAVK